MKPKITKEARIATLERQLKEAMASQAHVYHFASAALNKASTDHLMASGVIVTMTVLGGRELFSPVLIRDGLSSETIAALKADMARSFDLATAIRPKV